MDNKEINAVRQTELEEKLEKLFYNNPLYMPYVGPQYDNGILVVGESHYVKFDFENLNWHKDFLNEETFVRVWGTPAQREFDSVEAFSSYYNTRMVLAKYLNKRKENDFEPGSYVFFRNLEKVLSVALKKQEIDESSWEYCAFMNFYQVPSLKPSESIYDCFDILGYESLITRINSIETVKKTIMILNPKAVIVTSKKEAYELKQALPNVNIIRSTHPSSPWWNRAHGASNKSGREQLTEALLNLR